MPSKKFDKKPLPRSIINAQPSKYDYPFTSKERRALKTDGSIFLSRDKFYYEANINRPSGLRVFIPKKSRIFFGQPGVKKTFNNGPYKNKTIKDAAFEAYTSGSYYSMKFHYVERKNSEGEVVNVAENNRTLTFFAMLGLPPSDPINKTGISSHEKAVNRHNKDLDKGYSDSILVRQP